MHTPLFPLQSGTETDYAKSMQPSIHLTQCQYNRYIAANRLASILSTITVISQMFPTVNSCKEGGGGEEGGIF